MAAARMNSEKSAEALRSIGETAAEIGVQTHVVRYWESKFPVQVKPIKRQDGRRFFRPEDVDALRAIKSLVHDQGMTLKGAKAVLSKQGVHTVLQGSVTLSTGGASAEKTPPPAVLDLQKSVRAAFEDQSAAIRSAGSRMRLAAVLEEMGDIKQRLDAALARPA